MSQQLQPGQPISVSNNDNSPVNPAPVSTPLPQDDSSNSYSLPVSQLPQQPIQQSQDFITQGGSAIPFLSNLDDEDFDLEDETFVEDPVLPTEKPAPVMQAPATVPMQMPKIGQNSQAQQPLLAPNVNPAGSSFAKPPTLSMSLSKMPEDQRREVITRLFKLVVGKEPQEKDFNYYRFSALTEDGLIRNLLNTQEHKKILDQSGEFNTVQSSQRNMELKVKTLEMHLASLQNELKTLQEILEEKNRYIQNLRATINPVENMYLPIATIQEQPQIQYEQQPRQMPQQYEEEQFQQSYGQTMIPQHQEAPMIQSSLPSPIDELKQFIKGIFGIRRY
ncbi:MAG: hypothetical protein QY314_04295 [Candidatus Dojkabacteria bacterium]|nr:MAG: hypothetical protein QY314_04295 [Candidatus Dojkabacteria bacterium]